MLTITPKEVLAVVKTSKTEDDVYLFINNADLIVNELTKGLTISDAYLNKYKLYMAAHLLAVSDQDLKKKIKTDEIEEERAIKVGLGLDATPYGQQLKMMDVHGVFAKTGKRKATYEFLIP